MSFSRSRREQNEQQLKPAYERKARVVAEDKARIALKVKLKLKLCL